MASRALQRQLRRNFCIAVRPRQQLRGLHLPHTWFSKAASNSTHPARRFPSSPWLSNRLSSTAFHSSRQPAFASHRLASSQASSSANDASDTSSRSHAAPASSTSAGDDSRAQIGNFFSGKSSIRQLVESSTLSEKTLMKLGTFDAAVSAGADVKAENELCDLLREGHQLDNGRIAAMFQLWAAQCNYVKAQNFFNVLLADGYQLSPQALANVVLSYRQHPNKDEVHQLIHRIDDVLGVKPSDLLTKTSLDTFQQKQLIETIKRADPEFEAVVTSPAQDTTSEDAVLAQWRVEAGLSLQLHGLATKSALQQHADIETSATESGPSGTKSALSVWKPHLTRAIQKDRDEKIKLQQSAVRKPGGVGAAPYHEYLYAYSLTDEEIADCVIAEFERLLLDNIYGVRSSLMCMETGRSLFRKVFVKENLRRGMDERLQSVYREYLQLMNNKDFRTQHRAADVWSELSHKWGLPTEDSLLAPWPMNVILSCGSALVDMMLRVATVDAITGNPKDRSPAFFHTYDFVGAKRFGTIKACDALSQLTSFSNPETRKLKLSPAALLTRSLDATFVPMTVPPRPWTSVRQGGYLLSPVSIIRTNEDTYQHFALLAESSHQLGEVFDALNYLGSTEWAINDLVYDTVCKLFVEEDAVPDLEIPPAHVPPTETPKSFNTEADRAAYKEHVRTNKKERQDANSQRIDLALRLMVARHVRGRSFWLPHNLDFRGRCYVVPPYLTHIGNDLSRGLLKFAQPKPLGRSGLRWLKIHLSNVFGNDKCSLDERERFAEEHWDDIVDAATDPLGPSPKPGQPKWWRTAENPWQVLATCGELYRALTSPDPEAFESSLPVHQDGTCNGLQHYAALGRDIEGARHVNLVRTDEDRPQDVYSAVAKKVDHILSHHAAGDFSTFPVKDSETETKYQRLAEKLVATGPIKRKIVKQTVMTNVYGVTFIGGRDQILRQLKSFELVSQDDQFDAASYLTVLVFMSLDSMFSGAQAIQRWLNDQAFKIAKSGEPVAWLTPMGLPVVQPYHRKRRRHIKTDMQTLTSARSSNLQEPPNTSKQRSAFPPNFIHSLDSTHMMYTAIACRDDDVTFVAVHDSYWTHAATVDTMSKHTREQFVRLHSQPIMDNLYYFFKTHYEGRLIPGEGEVEIDPTPATGSFDINNVLDSPYFFS